MVPIDTENRIRDEFDRFDLGFFKLMALQSSLSRAAGKFN